MCTPVVQGSLFVATGGYDHQATWELNASPEGPQPCGSVKSAPLLQLKADKKNNRRDIVTVLLCLSFFYG